MPKTQARKLYTYAKEQLDLLKNPAQTVPLVDVVSPLDVTSEAEEVEEILAEEITNFAEIVPSTQSYEKFEESRENIVSDEKSLVDLSQEVLFEKLQNYKRLLDNGLIMQAEYDALKKEVLSKM